MGHLHWKNPKNSASGWNFPDPLPPLKMGPFDKKGGILYLKVIH